MRIGRLPELGLGRGKAEAEGRDLGVVLQARGEERVAGLGGPEGRDLGELFECRWRGRSPGERGGPRYCGTFSLNKSRSTAQEPNSSSTSDGFRLSAPPERPVPPRSRRPRPL